MTVKKFLAGGRKMVAQTLRFSTRILKKKAPEARVLMKIVLLASHRWGSLADIEEKNHVLSSKILNKCVNYSLEVFGSPRYALELARYCAIHGSWHEGWLPEGYFQNKIVSKSTAFPTLSRQKTLSSYFIQDEALPDIGYFSNGRFFTKHRERIDSEQVKDLIFANNDKVVFKSNSSMRGRGVFIFSYDEFTQEAVQRLGDGCFQEPIRPHPKVPSFGVPSVSTLRLVTTLDTDGDPTARFANLRLGRLDHTHVISDDSVKVLVCIRSGALQSVGYLADWTPVTAHPDTNIPFEGCIYPEVKDALSLCLRLHRQLPSFVSIGWDLCLNEGGDFKIMEWNQLHDIKFGEAVNGPNFSDLPWIKGEYAAQ